MDNYKLRKLLSDNGFYTQNLWHINDVQDKTDEEISDEEAQEVLHSVMTSSYIVEAIKDMIVEQLKK